MCIFLVLNVAKHQKCFYKTHAARNRQDMCIFLVLNVAKHQKSFSKTHAARNSCSKGNNGRSKSALAETDKIYVYILRSKRGKTPEMFSLVGYLSSHIHRALMELSVPRSSQFFWSYALGKLFVFWNR